MITIFTSHKYSIDKCPPNLKKNLSSWKSLNPSYNFKYYNDKELNNWMKEKTHNKIYQSFLLLASGAGKADLFRICHLYYDGGVWVDADLPAFDINKQKSDFTKCLYDNQAIIVENRKCNNPRYTFIASLSNNELFKNLINLININITEVLQSTYPVTTIHITGPFALHRLLKDKYNLQDIKYLKLNYQYKFDNNTFIYINDIIPERATYQEENVYSGYREDLRIMKVIPHGAIHCIKNK